MVSELAADQSSEADPVSAGGQVDQSACAAADRLELDLVGLPEQQAEADQSACAAVDRLESERADQSAEALGGQPEQSDLKVVLDREFESSRYGCLSLVFQ